MKNLYQELPKTKRPKGILWIGDPHVSSTKPSKRRGSDEEWQETVLGKLDKAIVIANENHFQGFITGDLFHHAKESNLSFLVRLTKVLKKAHYPLLCLGGNHDSSETFYDEGSALNLLHTTEVITVLGHEGAAAILHMDKTIVGLHAFPYNADMHSLPTDVTASWEGVTVDKVIATSHLDLEFETYPGVMSMHEIKGIDMVVNGHIHKTHEPRTHGKTTFFNQGNITRLSVDVKDHTPSVLSLNSLGETKVWVLDHVKGDDCFDLTGRNIVINTEKPEHQSNKALALLVQSTLTMGSNPTAESVVKLVEEHLEDKSDFTKQWMRSLLAKTTEKDSVQS